MRFATFSCASSITVIGPLRGLHDQVRHAMAAERARRWHRPPAATRRTRTPAVLQHVGQRRRRQQLVRVPATRLVHARARPPRPPAPAAADSSQNPPASSTASTTDAASAKRRAGARRGCLRNFASGNSSAARSAAVERQRLVAELAAGGAGRQVRASPRAAESCGSPPICRRAWRSRRQPSLIPRPPPASRP